MCPSVAATMAQSWQSSGHRRNALSTKSTQKSQKYGLRYGRPRSMASQAPGGRTCVPGTTSLPLRRLHAAQLSSPARSTATPLTCQSRRRRGRPLFSRPVSVNVSSGPETSLPSAGWRVQTWNDIHCLRIENGRIAVRFLRNRSARLDELVNPPQAGNARLPDRDSVSWDESVSVGRPPVRSSTRALRDGPAGRAHRTCFARPPCKRRCSIRAST